MKREEREERRGKREEHRSNVSCECPTSTLNGSFCWTWAGSPTWARLNPAHMPKEVEAVVLETTALNCPCTLNVHERIVQKKGFLEEIEIFRLFA